MKNTTNTNSTVLNNIYNNLIDYVSVIKEEEGGAKSSWVTNFVAQVEEGDKDFSFVYKNLKEGLISQFGFKQANEVILPEIIWSNNLTEFCD